MTAPTSIKDELHQRIDAMDDRAAIRLLAMLSLQEDDGELSDEEIEAIREAEEDMRAGHTIRGEDLERELGFRE
jgi:hypothetical protein